MVEGVVLGAGVYEYREGNGCITDNMRMQESRKDQLISDFSKMRSYLRL